MLVPFSQPRQRRYSSSDIADLRGKRKSRRNSTPNGAYAALAALAKRRNGGGNLPPQQKGEGVSGDINHRTVVM